MVGVTEGEYFPFTPSLTASLPLAPEYFGWSNSPSSIEKCRCPCPFCGFLPTASGSRVNPVSLTWAVTSLATAATAFGFRNDTFALEPLFAAVDEDADELALLSALPVD